MTGGDAVAVVLRMASILVLKYMAMTVCVDGCIRLLSNLRHSVRESGQPRVTADQYSACRRWNVERCRLNWARQAAFASSVRFCLKIFLSRRVLALMARQSALCHGARRRWRCLTISSAVWIQSTHVTDTGRQQRPRLRIASRGRNCVWQTLRKWLISRRVRGKATLNPKPRPSLYHYRQSLYNNKPVITPRPCMSM